MLGFRSGVNNTNRFNRCVRWFVFATRKKLTFEFVLNARSWVVPGSTDNVVIQYWQRTVGSHRADFFTVGMTHRTCGLHCIAISTVWQEQSSCQQVANLNISHSLFCATQQSLNQPAFILLDKSCFSFQSCFLVAHAGDSWRKSALCLESGINMILATCTKCWGYSNYLYWLNQYLVAMWPGVAC